MILSSLAPWVQAQQSDVADPLKLLAAVRADLSAMQAQFVQYELTADNQKLDINTGEVWMQSPDQFRWQYQDPIEQLIVADGSRVWVYDEDLEQVTVKEQDNQLNPIYVIINDELTEQYYNIKFELNHQNTDWISLTPKTPSEEVKAVWIAMTDDLIKSIKVFNQFDQTMVFEFNQIMRNPELPENHFLFEVPEGVDVIQAIGE